jgi:hypothetical protein
MVERVIMLVVQESKPQSLMPVTVERVVTIRVEVVAGRVDGPVTEMVTVVTAEKGLWSYVI